MGRIDIFANYYEYFRPYYFYYEELLEVITVYLGLLWVTWNHTTVYPFLYQKGIFDTI